jgi:hypothetical protein
LARSAWLSLQEGPLFTEYAVVNIVWTVVSADGTIDGLDQGVSIAATGIFRISGEFASQQQLSLDLSIDGGPLTHFDSGLVIGGGAFPLIDIEVSVNGFYCFDQVIHLIAESDWPFSTKGPMIEFGQDRSASETAPGRRHPITQAAFSRPLASPKPPELPAVLMSRVLHSKTAASRTARASKAVMPV